MYGMSIFIALMDIRSEFGIDRQNNAHFMYVLISHIISLRLNGHVRPSPILELLRLARSPPRSDTVSGKAGKTTKFFAFHVCSRYVRHPSHDT